MSASQAQQSHTWWLCTAALVPAALACWAMMQPADLQPLTVTKDRPSLLFATYLYHHGEDPVEADAVLESEFRFRNEGDQPVTIKKLHHSCSCMTPQIASRHIEPGETGSIYVPIQSVNQTPGSHEYTLMVDYLDPEPRTATLTIKATFPEKMVTVQPKALYLSQQSNQPVPFDLTITDFRDSGLTVTGVQSTAAFVTTEIAAARSVITPVSYENGPQPAKTRISGEVGSDVPPGMHHTLAIATTDDPDFAVVTVPIVVNGPPYAADEQVPTVTPSQVGLVASSHPNARRSARVNVVMPSEWEISHASAWPSQISVTYGEARKHAADGVVVPVEIELTEIPKRRVAHGVVQLYANDGRNLITCRVSLAWPQSDSQ